MRQITVSYSIRTSAYICLTCFICILVVFFPSNPQPLEISADVVKQNKTKQQTKQQTLNNIFWESLWAAPFSFIQTSGWMMDILEMHFSCSLRRHLVCHLRRTWTVVQLYRLMVNAHSSRNFLLKIDEACCDFVAVRFKYI